MAKFAITARILPDGSSFTAQGRDVWALSELIKVGSKGCTPIDHPGSCWSGYVFNLKRKHSLAIETVHENHGGQFAGSHARYVLHSSMEIISCFDMTELAAA